MPSKYAKKKPKPKTDQLYEPPEKVMCSNCGKYVSKFKENPYSKCYCGGTYQKFGAKPWPGKSELAMC